NSNDPGVEGLGVGASLTLVRDRIATDPIVRAAARVVAGDQTACVDPTTGYRGALFPPVSRRIVHVEQARACAVPLEDRKPDSGGVTCGGLQVRAQVR